MKLVIASPPVLYFLFLSLAHASPLQLNKTESSFTLSILPIEGKLLNLTSLDSVPAKYAFPIIVSSIRHKLQRLLMA